MTKDVYRYSNKFPFGISLSFNYSNRPPDLSIIVLYYSQHTSIVNRRSTVYYHYSMVYSLYSVARLRRLCVYVTIIIIIIIIKLSSRQSLMFHDHLTCIWLTRHIIVLSSFSILNTWQCGVIKGIPRDFLISVHILRLSCFICFRNLYWSAGPVSCTIYGR